MSQRHRCLHSSSCLCCSHEAWVCMGQGSACAQQHAPVRTTSFRTPWVNSAARLLIFVLPKAETKSELVWPWERGDPARSWGWHRVCDRLLWNTKGCIFAVIALTEREPSPSTHRSRAAGPGSPGLQGMSQAFKAEMGLLKSSQSDGGRSQVCSALFNWTLGQHPAPLMVLKDYKAEAARKSVWRQSFMLHGFQGLGSSQPL